MRGPGQAGATQRWCNVDGGTWLRLKSPMTYTYLPKHWIAPIMNFTLSRPIRHPLPMIKSIIPQCVTMYIDASDKSISPTQPLRWKTAGRMAVEMQGSLNSGKIWTVIGLR